MDCPFNKNELQSLYQEHRSVRGISEAVGGVTPRIVNRWMEQAGIKLRGGRPKAETPDRYLISYPKTGTEKDECPHNHRFDYGSHDVDDLQVEVCIDCGIILKKARVNRAASI